MNTTTNKNKVNTVNQTSVESDNVQNNRITLIEDALLESVSGGNAAGDGICIGHQFCEVPPHNDRG
jgi:hypothetical protein